MPRQSNLDSQLQDRIKAFVDDVSAIVREAALEAVRDALSNGTGAASPVSTRRETKASKKAAKRTKSGRRVRRSAEDLEHLGSTFLAHVKANPGRRLEQIGKALDIDTAELKRPVQLLMEAGQLRTEGERRGTKYFAGKGGARKAAGKKKVGTRKKATKRKTGKKKAAKKKQSAG